MAAIVENRVVRSKVENLIIPEVAVGAFIREAWVNFKDHAAIVSTRYKCHMKPYSTLGNTSV